MHLCTSKMLEQQETSNVNIWTDDRFKDQTHAFKMHLLTRMQNSNAYYAVSINIQNYFLRGLKIYENFQTARSITYVLVTSFSSENVLLFSHFKLGSLTQKNALSLHFENGS